VDRLVQVYREQAALGLLGAVRMIMWGNAVGIPDRFGAASRFGR
jgi:hypothetical protein